MLQYLTDASIKKYIMRPLVRTIKLITLVRYTLLGIASRQTNDFAYGVSTKQS